MLEEYKKEWSQVHTRGIDQKKKREEQTLITSKQFLIFKKKKIFFISNVYFIDRHVEHSLEIFERAIGIEMKNFHVNHFVLIIFLIDRDKFERFV